MKKFKHNFLVLFLMGLLILISSVSGIAEASPRSQGKVILLVIDNISYDDIVRYGGENLHYLLEHGALGLMNTNSGGSYKDSNSYATIGSGNYAVCSAEGIYVKKQDGSIVNQDLSNLVQANGQLNRPIKVGLLGTLLNDKGFKTAVIGSESIVPEAEVAEARSALITMNQQGVTNYGQVDSSLLKKDEEHPLGYSTDYDALYTAYQKFSLQADFIVIQSGDTHRLNRYDHISKEELAKAKATIFNNIDLFLGQVLESLDQDSLLLVVTPFPAREDIAAGKKLTPIIAYGDFVPSGILTSSTTKRDGIVTNTDVAAEIVSFFDLEKDFSMIGHRLMYKSHEKPLDFIENINRIAVFNYKHRSDIIRTFILFVMAVLWLYVICMCCCPRNLVYFKPFLLAIMLLPTVFLLLPLFNPWNMAMFTFLVLLLTAIAVLITMFLFQDIIGFFSIFMLFSAALIVGDTLLGNPLMKVSILGYDPIVGARFYGIGNEYMGYLVGSTLIGTASLIEKARYHRRWAKLCNLIIFALVFFILAGPSLGTNVGGAITAFLGFGTALVLMYKGKITKKDLLLLGTGIVVFLLILFIANGARRPEEQSHIGQLSQMVQQEGILALIQVAKRKLLMNYRLIKRSFWTQILLAMGIVLVGVFRHLAMAEISDCYPFLYNGFVAGIISAVVALLCNDSGVVAAATCLIPVVIPLLITTSYRFLK